MKIKYNQNDDLDLRNYINQTRKDLLRTVNKGRILKNLTTIHQHYKSKNNEDNAKPANGSNLLNFTPKDATILQEIRNILAYFLFKQNYLKNRNIHTARIMGKIMILFLKVTTL